MLEIKDSVAVARFGKINRVAPFAGIIRDGLMVSPDRETGKVTKKMPLDDFRRVLDVNLTGVFLTVRECVERMEPSAPASWQWRPYAAVPDVVSSGAPPTHVVCELEERPSGTVFVLSESGFDAIPKARPAEAYRLHREVWAGQMRSIEKCLAKAA